MSAGTDNDRYVRILILNNEIEAQLLDAALKERDIPHVLRSYHHLIYDGIFQTHKGWGQVDAPEEFKEDIVQIYEALASDKTTPDAGD